MKVRYKDVMAARELRLWIERVVIPIAGIYTLAPQETRDKVTAVAQDIKKKFTKH